MPKKGRMKPEFSLMEEECGFKTRTRKRTHKRMYHGLLSRKAFIRTTTQRTMTTQRRRDSNTVISAQYTKTELEEIEEVTRKSITDCAELKELFKSAIKHIQKSKGFFHPSP